MSEPLASLEKVCTAEYASEPDRFLAFVAEWARLRREMGAEAFWAACDELLGESPESLPTVSVDGLREDSVRTPCGQPHPTSDRPENQTLNRPENQTVGGPERGRFRGPDTPSHTPSHVRSGAGDAGVTRHVTLNRDVTPQSGVTG